MKTYKNLYPLICSKENLYIAFEKASSGKSNKKYVKKFEENLEEEINSLQSELQKQTYKPHPLKRFIIRDPKTRTIHASHFRDRVIYHALVNVIEEIFDKTFIYDSYACRVNKGTHNAVIRFDQYKRKISNNGKLVKNPYSNNSVTGYAFKADIKKYFDNVNHVILLDIIKRKIKDEKVIWLIKQILNNHDGEIKGKGMPLGNLTSQFFANVYLNELDYFVKHKLKVKYYLRYVDDFIILHKELKFLENYKREINDYLITNLKLQLHPDKSKIIPLRNGINLLGYRIFFKYKLLRVTNKRKFKKIFNEKLELYKIGSIPIEWLISSVKGWLGYAMWANTYKFRKAIINQINLIREEK